MSKQIRIQLRSRIWAGFVLMLLLVACLPADENPSALSAATKSVVRSSPPITQTPFPLTATAQSTKTLIGPTVGQTKSPATDTPRPTSTPVEPTRTPYPTSTQIPPTRTPRPTRTAVPPTRTTTPVEPSATPTITPTFTPLVTSNPSDEEVVRLLFDGRDSELFEYIKEELAVGKMSYEFTRQDVDLNGDGQPEILLYGYDDGFGLSPYISILGRTNGVWQPWLYTGNYSQRCADVRATVEQQRVLVDFLDCGPSATDQFHVTWEQRWIQCGENTCAVIWSAPLLRMSHFHSGERLRQYAVAELMTPDSNTIELTTRRFGLIEPRTQGEDALPDTTYRVVGPHTVEVFKWDGTTYQLEHDTQVAPEIKITGEFDTESQETVRLVNWILDSEAFANFWGLPSAKEANGAENQRWGSLYAAAHNGSSGELGEWVAGIVGAKDRPLCRLTIQQYNGQEFSLLERRELPCTTNFTRLAWADITGDQQDELLLLTIPPNIIGEHSISGMQRLHIYAVEGELVELATLDGYLNGPDGGPTGLRGVSIRWEDYDHDGTIDEILAGLPLVSLRDRTFAELTPYPRFQVYRWDAAQQTLIAGEIRP